MKNAFEDAILHKSLKTVYQLLHKRGFYSTWFENEKILWTDFNACGVTCDSYAIIFSNKNRAIKVETLTRNGNLLKSFDDFCAENNLVID